MVMAMLSRAPLASLVCPSAPFLAPRLLRTAACASASAHTRTYATKHTSKSKSKSKSSTNPPVLAWEKAQGKFRNKQGFVRYNRSANGSLAAETKLIEDLHNACSQRDVARLMDLYPTLLAMRVLTHQETRRICQLLHTHIRALPAYDPQLANVMLPFVQTIIADLRSGALDPHPYAYVHLLSIYKDSKRFAEGHALWQWLVQQDDTHVSQAAYGAAIELMAYGNLMPLPELENLYTEGLKRFPGTFSEYHLSPDAIVPDRTQPVAILGLPTVLLQGIFTARILARDWKKAYLALDTALRLYPAQTPSRFFELVLNERPISEAYTTYLLACRAGVCLNSGHITNLITRLRTAMKTSRSLTERMMLLRAIANGIYAYQQARGPLRSLHVGALILAFESLLPAKMPGDGYHGEDAELRNTIIVTAHEVMAGLLQSGLTPDIHPFRSLISLAGKYQVPDLLTTTLGDIKTAGIELGPADIRNTLKSAGILGDHALIEDLWSRIVASAESKGTQIDYSDWITFAKACRRASHADFLKDQLSKLAHTLTSTIEQDVHAEMLEIDTAPANPIHDMTPAQLTSEMELLKAQMKNIQAVVMSGAPLDVQKSPFYMHIDPEYPSLGSDEALRAVYDEHTTDPHQPPLPTPTDGSPVKVALSPTGIPLDELRFRNWVTILEVMNDAEIYEAKLQALVDKAIIQGTPLRSMPEILRLHKSKENITESKEALQTKVKHLRLPNLFRKIGSGIPEDMLKSMAKKPSGYKN